MKTVFRIATFDKGGNLKLLLKEYETYEQAENAIRLNCMDGVYQIQKVFVKFTEHETSDTLPF